MKQVLVRWMNPNGPDTTAETAYFDTVPRQGERVELSDGRIVKVDTVTHFAGILRQDGNYYPRGGDVACIFVIRL